MRAEILEVLLDLNPDRLEVLWIGHINTDTWTGIGVYVSYPR
jgi:hypothetical protein